MKIKEFGPRGWGGDVSLSPTRDWYKMNLVTAKKITLNYNIMAFSLNPHISLQQMYIMCTRL